MEIITFDHEKDNVAEAIGANHKEIALIIIQKAKKEKKTSEILLEIYNDKELTDAEKLAAAYMIGYANEQ